MTLKLITEGDFRSSRYGQMADQIEGRLSDLIEQAESFVEFEVDRKLYRETYTEMAEIGQRSLFLAEAPLISVTSIEVRRHGSQDGWQLVDAADYDIYASEGVVELTQVGSLNGSQVRVTYEAGYDPIPAIVKAAVILQTAYFAYQDFEIYGSGDGKPPGISYIQKEVKQLLAPFKRSKFA